MTRKTCYETEYEAESSARYVSELNKLELTIYLCEWCDMWHLTSRTEPVKPKPYKPRQRRKW